jgi:hypothetical protein
MHLGTLRLHVARSLAASVVLLLLCAHAAAQFGVQLATQDPGRVRFSRDPHVPCFFPGNMGQVFFRDDGAALFGNAGRRGELPCDAQLLLMLDEGYDVTPFDAPGVGGERGTFWERVQGVMGSASMVGLLLDFRFTDAFVERYARATETQKAQVFEQMAAVSARAFTPAFTVDLGDEAVASEISQRLKRAMPHALVGRVIRESLLAEAAAPAWDFLVVHEAAIPAQYTGQSAASYLKSLGAGRPVMLVMQQPSFYKQLFYLVAGVAGFYHQMPAPDSAGYDDVWRDLRAFAALGRRLPQRLAVGATEGIFEYRRGIRRRRHAAHASAASGHACHSGPPRQRRTP